jgi:ABC-2 type transport system permease protein
MAASAKLAIVTQLEYRMNLFTDAVFQPTITSAIEVAVWSAIFMAGATTTLAGYGRADYIAYALWAAFFARSTSNWMYEFKMSNEIETGTINGILVRPISFYEYYLGQFLGYKAFTLVLSLVPPSLVTLIWAGPTQLERLPLALLLVFYYLVFIHTLSFIFASLAFFVTRVWSLTVAKNLFLALLTGEIFPLDLLPVGIRDTLVNLPFSSAVYLPVGYLTGRVPLSDLLFGFVSTTAGLAVAAAVALTVWSLGRRSYAGTGA